MSARSVVSVSARVVAVVMIVLAMMMTPAPVCGQELPPIPPRNGAAQAPLEAALLPVTRVYDISMLAIPINQYDFAHLPGMRGDWWLTDDAYAYGDNSARRGIFEDDSDEPTPEERVVDYMKRTVRRSDNFAWESQGGRSIIEATESGVLVHAVPEVQAEVSAVLRGMTARRLDTLSMTLMAVELDDEFAKGLGITSGPVFRTVDDRAAMLKAVTKVHARVLLNGVDRQPLSTNTGGAMWYVADAEPVVAEAAVGFEAVLRVAPTGLSAMITPSVDPAEPGLVRLDYRLCYARHVATKEVSIQSAASGTTAESPLQLVDMLVDQHAGTMRIPLDAAVVLASAIVPTRLLDAAADVAATTPLYYVVVVRRVGEPVGPAGRASDPRAGGD